MCYTEDRHRDVVCEALYKQMETKACCDVELLVKSDSVHAHSCILTIFSPRCAQMIALMRQNQSNSYQMSLDFRANQLHTKFIKDAINFMYTGSIMLSKGNVKYITQVAELLQCKQLLNVCTDFKSKLEQLSKIKVGVSDVKVESSGCSNHNQEKHGHSHKRMRKEDVHVEEVQEPEDEIFDEDSVSLTTAYDYSENVGLCQETVLITDSNIDSDHNPKIEKNYKCPIEDCDFTCSAPSILEKHIRYKHKNEKAHVCHLCGKTMGWEAWHMERHLETVHKLGTQLSCDQCDFKTYEKQSLMAHSRLHSGAMKQCTYKDCGYKSNRTSHITQHVESKHKGVIHRCSVCNKEFSRRETLVSHTRLKHTREDWQVLCCEASCEFSTTLSSHLKKHISKEHPHINDVDTRVKQMFTAVKLKNET